PLEVSTMLRLGLIASLLLAFGLVRSDAAQIHWRPAQVIQAIFIEHFPPGETPEINMRPEIRALGLHIRNQGNRGTCTVFATTFLIEYQMATLHRGPHALALSEEYLNWAGNKATGEDQDGGFFTKFISGYQSYAISTAK